MKSLLAGVFGLEEIVKSESFRFIVIDGSTVQEPGATGTTYRLHIAIDLITLSIRQIEVTTDKEGEHLGHYELQAGDVVIVDRGYNQPKSIVPFLGKGGQIVLRYNAHSMTLYESNLQGQRLKIDWQTRLQTLHKQPGCIPVDLYHDGQRIRAYVHAIPLPPEKAQEARRKARARAKHNGRMASEKTLYLSEWILVLTSLPPEQINTETIAALYRARWQVELVIKRMKSLLEIDKLRARKDSQLAELYLHGKLLYATVIEKLAQKRFMHANRKMDSSRQLTDWRLWQMVTNEVRSGLIACFPARECFISDCIKSLSERRRKRSLQQLPLQVLQLIKNTFSYT